MQCTNEVKTGKNGCQGIYMNITRTIGLLIFMAAVFAVVAHAEDFSASSLTANDVDCRKCHTDTPHLIHAKKPVECVNCHGDKISVSIPKCTKCHDGPIHKVHAGKVSTQSCSYCHKTIEAIHNAIISDAVCSHCHRDLVEVHGKDAACAKCHKSPPGIVKPLKSEGMVLICQDCHRQTSVATNATKALQKLRAAKHLTLSMPRKWTARGVMKRTGKLSYPSARDATT